MFDLSPVQILLALAVALIVFGPKRLPEMGRNLGRGLREFKSSIGGGDAAPALPEVEPAVRAEERSTAV